MCALKRRWKKKIFHFVFGGRRGDGIHENSERLKSETQTVTCARLSFHSHWNQCHPAAQNDNNPMEHARVCYGIRATMKCHAEHPEISWVQPTASLCFTSRERAHNTKAFRMEWLVGLENLLKYSVSIELNFMRKNLYLRCEHWFLVLCQFWQHP